MEPTTTADPVPHKSRVPHWGWWIIGTVTLCLSLYAACSIAADVVPNKAEILTDGTKAGQERDDNGLKMKLVWCPPGRFKMGSPENERNRDANEGQVDVLLRRGFWLGKYEVTQGEFSVSVL
jgi:formylglycine-generating enzyme required for sulfatase activity